VVRRNTAEQEFLPQHDLCYEKEGEERLLTIGATKKKGKFWSIRFISSQRPVFFIKYSFNRPVLPQLFLTEVTSRRSPVFFQKVFDGYCVPIKFFGRRVQKLLWQFTLLREEREFLTVTHRQSEKKGIVCVWRALGDTICSVASVLL